MSSIIEFESAREKEKKRQWEREARQAVLDKAKAQYEAEEARKQAARQRGEHTWMLPSVESRLHSEKSAKKKKKKDKKTKKKKKKKKKEDSSASSSSDGEGEEEEQQWVEKGSRIAATSMPPPAATTSQPRATTPPTTPARRDGWMEMTSLFGTYSRDEMREREGTSRKKQKEEEERKKREMDKPGTHARELNPYFKDGGTGLPEEGKQERPAPMAGMDAAWLRRALQRAQEQARQEGRSLQEVAGQRWGSLEKFNELLAEAEGRGKESYCESKSKVRRDREDRSRDRETSRHRNRRSRSKSSEEEKIRERSRINERSRNKEQRRGRTHYSSSSSDESSRKKGRERRQSSSSSSDESSRKKDRERRRSSSSSSERRGYREKKRSRSLEKKKRHKKRSSSSSSGGDRKARDEYDSEPKLTSSFKKPSDSQQSLSSRFQKPGEGQHESRRGSRGKDSVGSRTRPGWQKKEVKPVMQQPDSVSSSSSTSASSDSEEEPTSSKEAVAEKKEPQAGEAAAAAAALTDKQMNELAAKIMKAELVGNDTLATKLKAKMEAAREVRAFASSSRARQDGQDGAEEQVVVLTRMDSRGVCRPVQGAEQGVRGERKKKVKTHGRDGQRDRYFPDDDRLNLKHMFEKEKGTTAEDQNSMFEEAAMRNSERLNDEYDIDDMFMSKAAVRDNSARQAERDRLRAIKEHQRSERSLESCQWCFDSKDMPKHLIVALGTKCYVCLPAHESLTPGHCLIVPVHHIPSCVQADEDLWTEIQMFRRSLVKMFNSRDEDCVFFETVKRLRYFPHTALSCVPLSREMGDMAPIYFKKAIMECEAEWAQNKKLVELKNRDVRRAVPKGLPYFFVDFAMDPGYAHVIEDEKDFPNNFAQEIIGGMLDLDNNVWRKPRRENFDAQRRKVMQFSKWYKEFDPTQAQD